MALAALELTAAVVGEAVKADGSDADEQSGLHIGDIIGFATCGVVAVIIVIICCVYFPGCCIYRRRERAAAAGFDRLERVSTISAPSEMTQSQDGVAAFGDKDIIASSPANEIKQY